jgi:hypothetical protein
MNDVDYTEPGKRMGSGEPHGLQNQRSSSFGGDGGFDSHSLPPSFNNLGGPAISLQSFAD